MASGRRLGSPYLKGTLGTLIRTTLVQVSALREAIERQARSQKDWFDSALLQRRRSDAMAALGELVFELANRGDLGDLDDFPELVEIVRQIRELDDEVVEARGARPRHGGTPATASRREPVPVWRPVVDDDDTERHRAADEPAPRLTRSSRRRPAREKSGITFIEDDLGADAFEDDLADYMHEDDVPGGGGDS